MYEYHDPVLTVISEWYRIFHKIVELDLYSELINNINKQIKHLYPCFIRGNKIWVRVRVRMNLNTSEQARVI